MTKLRKRQAMDAFQEAKNKSKYQTTAFRGSRGSAY
jgi:hypothetical protein